MRWSLLSIDISVSPTPTIMGLPLIWYQQSHAYNPYCKQHAWHKSNRQPRKPWLCKKHARIFLPPLPLTRRPKKLHWTEIMALLNQILDFLNRIIFWWNAPHHTGSQVKSWTKTRCEHCGKVGSVVKTCFANEGFFSTSSCPEYNKSHTHHSCVDCKHHWITAIT